MLSTTARTVKVMTSSVQVAIRHKDQCAPWKDAKAFPSREAALEAAGTFSSTIGHTLTTLRGEASQKILDAMISGCTENYEAAEDFSVLVSEQHQVWVIVRVA